MSCCWSYTTLTETTATCTWNQKHRWCRIVPHLLTLEIPLDFSRKVGQGSYGAVYAVNYGRTSCITKRLWDIFLGPGGYEPVNDQEKKYCHQKFIHECVLLSRKPRYFLVWCYSFVCCNTIFSRTLLWSCSRCCACQGRVWAIQAPEIDQERRPELSFLILWCLSDNPMMRPSTFCVNILLRAMTIDLWVCMYMYVQIYMLLFCTWLHWCTAIVMHVQHDMYNGHGRLQLQAVFCI